MKKSFWLFFIVSLLLSSCYHLNTEQTVSNETSTSAVTESSSQIIETTVDNSIKEYDYFNSYDTEIASEVDNAILTSSSLQDEMTQIKRIADTYENASSNANNQSEINYSSSWSYTVWDKELNNLWDRISKNADEETKKNLLTAQRNWIAMKEEIILENIGSEEDSGSIYTLLKNNLLSEITSNRCYILANELAKIKNENFTMPKRHVYCTYVDNQGTSNVYSSLITRKNIENDDEAIISIHRLGKTEGTFISNDDGSLTYTSYDENVKGIIQIDGWNKATFEIVESKDSPFVVGETYTFDFAI
ncbi:MAG: DUF1311 domain-containing protein [Lachnospiraceae bacterium]|nr:DUF1311 domain-containing protein [Lachnospiraceae bacterium]